jgi:hypothetical protein
MKLVSLSILVVALSGCTLLHGRKTNSGWVVLEKADDASCGVWPKQEQDLAVNELILARGKPKGILSSGLKRDGSPNYYFAPWKDDVDFDAEQLVPLKLGRNSVMIGGASLGAKPVFDVVFNTRDKNGNAKSSLEVRNVKDNLVRFKGDLGGDAVQNGSLVVAGDVHWIVYKKDDADFGAARLGFVKEKGAIVPVTGLAMKDRPVIVPAPGGKGEALIIYKEGDDPKPFKVRKIGVDGKVGLPSSLDVTVDNGVESWTATQSGGAYYMALVDGDSLIGQADLKVTAFDWVDEAAAAKWTKSVAIKDVHVSDPVFLNSAKGLQVLTLNWVDDESTIARYVVAGGAVGKPVYTGIFPKGSRIVDAFAGNDAGDTYAIMRHKDDTSWIFQLCKL